MHGDSDSVASVPRFISDKIASEFDAMLDSIEESDGADATVKAMGEFDTGYDEVAQAAARQAM